MGALEDDIDYAIGVQRTKNRESHTLLDENADWDALQCTVCNRRGGVDLSFNACTRCTCGSANDYGNNPDCLVHRRVIKV